MLMERSDIRNLPSSKLIFKIIFFWFSLYFQKQCCLIFDGPENHLLLNVGNNCSFSFNNNIIPIQIYHVLTKNKFEYFQIFSQAESGQFHSTKTKAKVGRFQKFFPWWRSRLGYVNHFRQENFTNVNF